MANFDLRLISEFMLDQSIKIEHIRDQKYKIKKKNNNNSGNQK